MQHCTNTTTVSDAMYVYTSEYSEMYSYITNLPGFELLKIIRRNTGGGTSLKKALCPSIRENEGTIGFGDAGALSVVHAGKSISCTSFAIKAVC